METCKLVMSPSARWTRILLTSGSDEMMRALLPAPRCIRHPRAAATLLEGLSLWMDAPLTVALSVDAELTGASLGLTDDLGVGIHTVFYRVEVVERGRRRRGVRIRGIGDFADLRQLQLVR